MPTTSSDTGAGQEGQKAKSGKSAPQEVQKPCPNPWPAVNYALKAKYAAYTTLVYFLIANPETYKLVQKLIGGWVTVASEGGCPTPTGFFLHAGLFFFVLWSFMLFPKDF